MKATEYNLLTLVVNVCTVPITAVACLCLSSAKCREAIWTFTPIKGGMKASFFSMYEDFG